MASYCSHYIHLPKNNTTGHLPVPPTLESYSLKDMHSKLTNVYKEENKEPEGAIAPEREGKEKNEIFS